MANVSGIAELMELAVPKHNRKKTINKLFKSRTELRQALILAILLLCAVKTLVMIDYSKVSQYDEVIELIKKREQIEKEIIAIDEMALVEYELQKLQLNDVEEEKTIGLRENK